MSGLKTQKPSSRLKNQILQNYNTSSPEDREEKYYSYRINDYPIVLVHGFLGWAPDESPMFGNYFKCADEPTVRG